MLHFWLHMKTKSSSCQSLGPSESKKVQSMAPTNLGSRSVPITRHARKNCDVKKMVRLSDKNNQMELRQQLFTTQRNRTRLIMYEHARLKSTHEDGLHNFTSDGGGLWILNSCQINALDPQGQNNSFRNRLQNVLHLENGTYIGYTKTQRHGRTRCDQDFVFMRNSRERDGEGVEKN